MVNLVRFWVVIGSGFFKLECGDRFQVTLDLYSECGDQSIVKDFTYFCDEFSINYPDLVFCSNNQNFQIQGDISNCNGCTFEWSPSQYLDNPSAPFPIVLGSSNANALFQTYNVTATTPVGCQYNDDLRIIQTIQIAGEINLYREFINHCEYEIFANVEFGSPVNLSDVNVYFSVYEGSRATSYFEGELTSTPGVSSTGTFKLPSTYSRLDEITFNGVASFGELDLLDGFNNLGNCVIQSGDFTPPMDFNNIYIPEIFSPINQNGIDDYFNPWFHLTNSSIWYAKLSVFDRWGGLLFSGEKYKTGQFSESGLRGDEDELKWDGRFNGEMMNTGVYTYILEYSDCTGENLIKNGDVTLK